MCLKRLEIPVIDVRGWGEVQLQDGNFLKFDWDSKSTWFLENHLGVSKPYVDQVINWVKEGNELPEAIKVYLEK